LFDSTQYEAYCRAAENPELRPLIFKSKEAKERMATLRKQPVTLIQPGDAVYVKLQGIHELGWTWYEQLALPDYKTTTYVVKGVCDRYSGPKSNKLHAVCIHYPTLGLKKEYYNDWVHYWANFREPLVRINDPDDPTKHGTIKVEFRLIDDDFVRNFPQLQGRTSIAKSRPKQPTEPLPSPQPAPAPQPRRSARISEEPLVPIRTDKWGYVIGRQKRDTEET
jgi:hypothetical protein